MIRNQCKKRKRSANFSVNEKMELIQLISKYKNVIENKKTDNNSVTEKNKTWEKVAREFNAVAPESSYRDAEVIHRFYENKKKEVRKIAAYEKQYARKTGGGPPPDIKKDPFYDFILSIINEKTVYGLQNRFDSDVYNNQENIEIVEENVFELNRHAYNETIDFECIEAIEDMESSYTATANNLPLPNNEEQLNATKNVQIEIICTDEPLPSSMKERNIPSTSDVTKDNWKKVTPKDLQKTISTPLRSTADGTERRSLIRKRPATVVKALTSSNIAEKYDELIDRRLRIAERMENEFKQKTLEHLKRLELLDLEIDLKKKQLYSYEK